MGRPTADETEARLAAMLAAAPTMYLSTSDGDVPWVAGCYVAEDGVFVLRIISEVSGRTLANLRANPTAAVLLSTGDPMAGWAQAQVTATEVVDEAGQATTKAALLAKTPAIEPFFAVEVATVRLAVASWKLTDILAGWFGVTLEP